jgi:hypothetical protein
MGKYTITLSNQATTLDFYDFEINGQNVFSTPRSINSIDDAPILGAKTLTIFSDLTSRFVTGFVFEIHDGGGNNGTYTVVSSAFAGTLTTITVVENITNVAPFGTVKYTLPSSEVHTSLALPGRGSLSFGDDELSNAIHMLEHFASDTAPNNPIIGQIWYDTSGVPSYKYFSTGSTWEELNVASSVQFIDPEHPTNTTTATYALKGVDGISGVSIKALENPNVGDTIFSILDDTNINQFSVSYNGDVESRSSIKILSSDLIKTSGSLKLESISSGHTLKLTNTTANDILRIAATGGGTVLKVAQSGIVPSRLLIGATSFVAMTAANEKLNIIGDSYFNGKIKVDNDVIGQPSIQTKINPEVGIKFSNVDATGGDINFVTKTNITGLSVLKSGILRADPDGNIGTGYETLVSHDNDLVTKKYIETGIVLGSGGIITKTGVADLINPSGTIKFVAPSGDSITIGQGDGTPINDTPLVHFHNNGVIAAQNNLDLLIDESDTGNTFRVRSPGIIPGTHKDVIKVTSAGVPSTGDTTTSDFITLVEALSPVEEDKTIPTIGYLKKHGTSNIINQQYIGQPSQIAGSGASLPTLTFNGNQLRSDRGLKVWDQTFDLSTKDCDIVIECSVNISSRVWSTYRHTTTGTAGYHMTYGHAPIAGLANGRIHPNGNYTILALWCYQAALLPGIILPDALSVMSNFKSGTIDIHGITYGTMTCRTVILKADLEARFPIATFGNSIRFQLNAGHPYNGAPHTNDLIYSGAINIGNGINNITEFLPPNKSSVIVTEYQPGSVNI